MASLRLLLGLLVGFPVGLLVGLAWLLWGEGCLHLEAVACLLESGVPLWTLGLCKPLRCRKG